MASGGTGGRLFNNADLRLTLQSNLDIQATKLTEESLGNAIKLPLG